MSEIYKLDRKRSYGIVTGDPNIGFVQDGNTYRHDGTLFAKNGEEAPVVAQGQGTIPPEPAEDPEMERQSNKKKSEAMQKVWAARKDRFGKEDDK